MQVRVTRVAVVAGLLTIAACGGSQKSDGLAVELESAAGAESQLVPRSEGVQFVSELEQNAPKVERAIAAPRPDARVSRAAPAPPKATTADVPPAPVPSAPAAQVQIDQPAQVATPRPSVESAPRGIPLPQGETRRAPPGGWKSPSEVIRNAPFPIKP